MSQGDMTLELGQSHTNRGEMVANGTLSLSVQGNLDNSGKLAGANVSIHAGNITNATTGEISSIGLTRLDTSAAASTATASPSRPALSTTWRPTSVVWLGPAPSPPASAWTWALGP
ncbi:hypothetical protein G6F57_020630 [Rhizopus arrhizus]|nr:hypothetical protein G6F57_020630 [Rhizopus arrhizus]